MTFRTPLAAALLFASVQGQAFGQCDLRWKAAPGDGLPFKDCFFFNDGLEFNDLLVIGGAFPVLGSQDIGDLAAWNGSQWSALGQNAPTNVDDLHIFDGKLYAAALSAFARLDGNTWTNLDLGPNIQATALTTFGGQLMVASGLKPELSTSKVLVLENGVFNALPGSFNGPIYTMLEYNGSLYVGGQFSTIDSVPAENLARWDGAAWTAIGSTEYSVRDLEIWDGKLAVANYADFGAGGAIHLWDDANWSQLSYVGTSWWDYMTIDMHVYNGKLIEAGHGDVFSPPLQQFLFGGISEWTGSGWVEVDGGISDSQGCDFQHVGMLVDFKGELHAFGSFSKAGGLDSMIWAILSCECYADCDGDSALSIDDFICFQTLFALGEPAADCDGDTALTIDDFICYQTSFALGC